MISVKLHQGVATVTLDRPEKHNAFDDSTILQLTDAFKQIDQDNDVRVMVLAANGKSFSAGADLNWMQRMANYTLEENIEDATHLATMLQSLSTMRKPTIARVQGAAFGGAVGLVSCCDMAVGSNNASFCLSEVKIGLIPATISPYVIAAMGERAARRYFLTAERFDAIKAMQLGLLSEVCAPEELDDAVAKLIRTLMANGPAAITQAKALILDYANREISQALINDSSQRIAGVRVSIEGQEGLKAFLDKREPAWKSSSPSKQNAIEAKKNV